MTKTQVILFFIAAFLLNEKSSAGPFERAGDTRTTLPENIIKQRKVWGLDFDAGSSVNSGNTILAGGKGELVAFRRWDASMIYFQARYIVLGTGEKFNRIQNQGVQSLRYDYELDSRWKLFVFDTNAFNELQGIKYRGTIGAGPWYQWPGEEIKNGLSLAVTYEFEDFAKYKAERMQRLSLRNVFDWSFTESSKTGFDFFYTPALRDFDDWRLSLAPYLQVMIRDPISIKIAYLFEHDSRPKPGVNPNDGEFMTSLMFQWGE